MKTYHQVYNSLGRGVHAKRGGTTVALFTNVFVCACEYDYGTTVSGVTIGM